MWFEDLTTHSFGRLEIPRVAIGWLSKSKPFTIGETPNVVYEKLCELNKKPWMDYISMGYHECEFCPKIDNKQLNPLPETWGNHNLTIPHEGKLYHYPELITHYIK